MQNMNRSVNAELGGAAFASVTAEAPLLDIAKAEYKAWFVRSLRANCVKPIIEVYADEMMANNSLSTPQYQAAITEFALKMTQGHSALLSLGYDEKAIDKIITGTNKPRINLAHSR